MKKSVVTKSDEQLQAEIIDALAVEPTLDASTIGVAVRDGVVTLVGRVPSFAERDAAKRTVKEISGVRSLQVKLKSPKQS